MERVIQEEAVKKRYAAAAQAQEAALCCPVEYDQSMLEVIPQEVLEKDYGCGDPSDYLSSGETVLDLGSGAGKICFIAAQRVGSNGRVIGVDMTDEMLEVANRNAPIVAERLGYSNVEFRKGRLQDLALDLNRLDRELQHRPVRDVNGFLETESLVQRLREEEPLVAASSVDVVVSNCVLNLVENHLKQGLFHEIYRVLRRGGRAVISDIVSDEAVPPEMQSDPELWSGCISGAFTEEGFLKAFEDAGFHGLTIRDFSEEPWQTVNGIQFRSITVEAFKGKEGPCYEKNQALIYKGPYKAVLDDDGHRFERGRRHAVCEKTFKLFQQAPYSNDFEWVEPLNPVPEGDVRPFDCTRTERRDPRETKGESYSETTDASSCCNEGGCT